MFRDLSVPSLSRGAPSTIESLDMNEFKMKSIADQNTKKSRMKSKKKTEESSNRLLITEVDIEKLQE